MNTNATAERIRRRLPRAMLVFIALVLTGCGMKMEVGYEDPSFNSAATLQRPVAVGGVVWSAGSVEREPEVSAALEKVLWNRLLKDIGPNRLKQEQWVSEALDSADRAHILQTLDVSGSIDSAGCDRLCSVFRDSSALIIFGRLVEDKFDTNTYSMEDGSVTTAIERTVCINLAVYDPVLGKDIWRAQVSNMDRDIESSGEESGLGETLVSIGASILLQAMFGGDDEEQPPPVFRSSPELIDNAWEIYGKLGKALAGKE